MLKHLCLYLAFSPAISRSKGHENQWQEVHGDTLNPGTLWSWHVSPRGSQKQVCLTEMEEYLNMIGLFRGTFWSQTRQRSVSVAFISERFLIRTEIHQRSDVIDGTLAPIPSALFGSRWQQTWNPAPPLTVGWSECSAVSLWEVICSLSSFFLDGSLWRNNTNYSLPWIAYECGSVIKL